MKRKYEKDQRHYYKLRLRNFLETSLRLEDIVSSLNDKKAKGIQVYDGSILFSHYISPNQIYRYLGYQKTEVRIKNLLD